jgi:hypothetical protein
LPLLELSLVRTPRIKVSAEEGEATYHCMSRTVNREWLFDGFSKGRVQ